MKLALMLLTTAFVLSPQGVNLPGGSASLGSLPAKETFHYDVEWRLITAGRARVEYVRRPNSDWQVNLRLESAGMVSTLYKVEDDYFAYLSPSLCAESVQQVSHEGSRFRDTKIAFNLPARRATYEERDRIKNTVLNHHDLEIPSCVHDVMGSILLLRTLNLEPGKSTMVPITDGKKSVMAKVEAQAREDIKTPEGTFHTIRYEAYLFNDVLYRRAAHLNIWVTDDRRRLPVQIRVRMQFTIGTITFLLRKHEGS
jgi:hypothetical protein